MRRLLAMLCLGLGLTAQAQTPSTPDELARGQYILRASGCVACHTSDAGQPLAGGRRIETPFGVLFSPNITGDKTHGIGNWTESQFIAAVREGRRPQGGRYYPAFPYTSYAAMTDADAKALFAYLRSTPPLATPNQPHDLSWPFSMRWLMLAWQWMFFKGAPPLPEPAQTSPSLERGRYLTALGHCAECHMPRNRMGALQWEEGMRGVSAGSISPPAPNITPSRQAIGDWTLAELEEFLNTGVKPNFDDVQGSMREVIEQGTVHLTPQDRRAMAEYLLAMPPRPGP